MSTASKTRAAADAPDLLSESAAPPTDHDLQAALGAAHGPLAEVVAWLRHREPAMGCEWKFAPLSGWYQIYVLKRRRLFYLLPRPRAFRMVILLDARALTALRQGPLGGGADALISGAKSYPEGMAFTLESRGFYPEIAIALLAAKLEA